MTSNAARPTSVTEEHITGCLLGTAVGDAIGLPYEGMSRRRSAKIIKLLLKHSFLFGRGMVSDDTEHTRMVAQSIISSEGDPNRFQEDLSRRLRWWLALVPAGTGLATLKSIIKLWCGISPSRSGVYSAGNGSAMRSAIIGVAVPRLTHAINLTEISTQLTHSDPKALHGSIAITIAAAMSRDNVHVDADEYLSMVTRAVGTDGHEFINLLQQAAASAAREDTTEQFADQIGLAGGVTGYTYHTVPVVVHAWIRHHNNFKKAVTAVVRCGGDTDTTAAIVGGLVGIRCGTAGIPTDWLNLLCEWPATVRWTRRLGQQLHETVSSGHAQKPLSLFLPAVLLRNLVFLMVVLVHGFRRLLPPW